MKDLSLKEKIDLWNKINEYVVICGGDTSNKTISNKRMNLVVEIEKFIKNLR